MRQETSWSIGACKASRAPACNSLNSLGSRKLSRIHLISNALYLSGDVRRCGFASIVNAVGNDVVESIQRHIIEWHMSSCVKYEQPG